MTDPAFGKAAAGPALQDAPALEQADRAVRALVWILLVAILLITIVAVVTIAKGLLAVFAGATTLLALAAATAAALLWYRVRALDERLRRLEARQRQG